MNNRNGHVDDVFNPVYMYSFSVFQCSNLLRQIFSELLKKNRECNLMQAIVHCSVYYPS